MHTEDSLKRLHLARRIAGVALAGVLAGAAALPPAANAAEACTLEVNCIANPSLEEDIDDGEGLPSGWRTNTFGASDAAFTLTEGRTGDRAATVTVSSHTAPQDAKWVFDEVPVIGGQYYVFGDWYKSSVPTEIYAFFHGGTTPYIRIMEVPPSESPDSWSEVTTPKFLVPAGATAMTVTHSLVGDGTVTTDDHALTLVPAPVFRHGLVSLSFDDGWRSVHDNALPILDKAGFKSTQYIYTDPIVGSPGDYPNNMSTREVLAMQRQGHEIGAHSRLHRSLLDMDEDERRREIEGSRTDLLAVGVSDVSTFAYPYGAYDEDMRDMVAAKFRGARTTDLGANTTDADRHALRTRLVLKTTTADEIIGWINHALANNLWLILTFHRVEPTLDDCYFSDGAEDGSCTDVATLQAVVDHLKSVAPGFVTTIGEILDDEELWSQRPPDEPRGEVRPVAGTGGSWDPPSTYAGEKVTLELVMNAAYAAGFRSEEQLVSALGIAIGESDLWTAARNWQPDKGFRPKDEVIGVQGPRQAWSRDRRQMHSDRGLYQLSSQWWSQYSDAYVDDPATASLAFFDASKRGTDFSIWDSYRRGRARSHFDQPHRGWPTLRPLVRNFLARVAPDETLVAEVDDATEDASEPEAVAAFEPGVKLAAAGFAPDIPVAPTRAENADAVLAALGQAAEAGNGWAQIGLAEMLIRGDGAPADPERAVALLERAAAGGLKGPALGTLGAYYRSIGDHERALAALEEAAAAGDGWAQLRLADMLFKGEGTAHDPARAVALLEEAANGELAVPAFMALAQYHRSAGNHAEARAALTGAADAGEAEAKLLLANMLIKGDGGPAEPQRALVLLVEAAAAGFTGPVAATLGEYYRAIGDNERALIKLQAAAEAGEVRAKAILADMLIKGEGTDVDPTRAIALLEEVAEAGLATPAFRSIADHYREIGDDEHARIFLQRAAETGDAEAKFALAEMLITGEGGPADPDRAIGLLDAAAGADMAAAKLRLGELLLAGDGIAADPARAIPLLEAAGDGGLAGPAYGLIGRYHREAGNAEKALVALESAVAAGDADAKLALGEMLIAGAETETDAEKAIALLEASADGDREATAYRILGAYYLEIGEREQAAAALERAAEAGDGWSKITLAGMLIDGDGTRPDHKRARALLEDALREDKNPLAYTRLVELTAAEFRSADELDGTLSLLRDAGAADASIALDSFTRLKPHSKTAIVQAILREAGYYSGSVDGRLTRRTLRAIGKFCKGNDIPECRSEAFPVALLSALIRTL